MFQLVCSTTLIIEFNDDSECVFIEKKKDGENMSANQFKPAWWLPNSHLQTIWPAICRFGIKNLPIERERLELPDGDFIDLDWIDRQKSGPIVLILHGFEGSIESHYSKGMLLTLNLHGWRGVFMHFRGCSGEPNRLPRGYHSGETSDLSYVMKVLLEREPNNHFAAIGYSLGGNVLLKWLGETGTQNPLNAAIAISVPFELHKAAARIQQGFSRFYQWYLVRCARGRLVEKFQKIQSTIDIAQLSEIQGLHDLDDKYTVPFHGFNSIDEYYTTASSRQYMRSIQIPTLVLHAKDDPFMTEDVIPDPKEVSQHVRLEITESGGHVGFVAGKYPWAPEYWLETRVPEFLKEYL
jgi:predicted alpha/beta-fold hydrolase